jgi:hypothetical protein
MSYIWILLGYFAVSAVAGVGLAGIMVLLTGQKKEKLTIFILLSALALIGACAGLSGGMSRAAAVGEIIPAFLGLLGGISVYLFGVDQSKGLVASLGAACLSISLFVSYTLGSQLRNIGDDHRDVRAICAKAYTDSELLRDQKAYELFRNQLGKACDRSMNWWIAD